jgi:glycopeptide antibiotics resistance protein
MLNDTHPPPANTAYWLTTAYALVLIYVSLHPLGALRWSDAAPWGFVFKPWSKSGVTPFDVWINLLAYVPLGLGLAHLLSVSRVSRWVKKRFRNSIKIVLALLIGAGLSFFLESMQSYSSVRVASMWDVVCNSAGVLFGGVLAALLEGRMAWLKRLLNHIIGPHRGALWAVIGLWGLAQLHPQGWSFMTAPLALLADGWIAARTSSLPLTAIQLQSLETVASVVALSGMLSLIRLALHKQLSLIERSVCLLIGLLMVMLWQAIAYNLQYGWGEWRLLANTGFINAIIYIALAYVAWALLPAPWVAVGAVLSLAVHTALAQILPPHPYTSSAELWQQGRLIHLYGLTTVVSALWPIMALAALVLQSRYFDSNRALQRQNFL